MGTWTWPGAVITRVVDGDTLDARVTRCLGPEVLGFGRTLTLDTMVRLRLAGINAPPAGSPAGDAATEWVRDWVDAARVVTVTTIRPYKFGGPKMDSAGEWVATVEGPQGRDLSRELVEAGHAVWWSGAGPRPGG